MDNAKNRIMPKSDALRYLNLRGLYDKSNRKKYNTGKKNTRNIEIIGNLPIITEKYSNKVK
jgi:hypothetical protein